MVTVTVNSSIGNLNNISKEFIERGLDLTAQELIANLMDNSPVDHGLLKSWALTDSTETTRVVQSPAEYAEYVNYGTSAHDIYPKGQGTFHAGRQLTQGSALWWPGAEHPVRHVWHPGIEGKHFVEDSIEATSARIQEFFTINGG